MGTLVFDLDNTLYSFAETGVELAMRANIVEFLRTRLQLTEAAASQLSTEYYLKYGLTGRGLRIHHPEIDIEEYILFVHDLRGCSIPSDPELRQMLIDLRDRGGWDLWLMTNGCAMHAERVLHEIGIWDVFAGRVWDCRDQWRASAPEVHNKPERTAYEHFAKHIGASGGKTFVMVEDSMTNLLAPASMGWKPVWISYGRQTPPDAPPTCIAIESVKHLASALS